MKNQKKTIKEKLIEIIRNVIGMPEHFDDKKYVEAIDHLYGEPIATEILNLFKKELDDAFRHLMKEFANTPIDERGTGWDWLKKARDKLLEELK